MATKTEQVALLKMTIDMEEKDLSARMRDEAIGLGLCKQWTEEWGDAGKHAMCEKFIDGLDFCINHNWPSVDVIKNEFGDVMHEYGIYADESVNIDGEGTIVLNGHCEGSIGVTDTSVGNIYVRHSSEARINVKDYAYVHINVYDNASVVVSCEATARCFVYHYGGQVKVEGKHVVIRERNLK